MDYHKFPFDRQRCGIDLELYRSRVSDVVLEARAKDVDFGFSSIETAQWTNFTEFYEEGYREYSTGRFSYAHIRFGMVRVLPYWIWNAIVPAVLFVCISYSGFWIDAAAAPGRIALATMSVLFSLTDKVRVTSFMPAVPYHVWLIAYLLGCIIFNLAAVISYSIVNFGRTEKLKLQVDIEAVRPVELGEAEKGDAEATRRIKLDRCLSYFSNIRWFFPLAWHSAGSSHWTSTCMKLDWHMRWFFPLAFIIYNICMFSMVDSFAPEVA
jgi:hypothetical protein